MSQGYANFSFVCYSGNSGETYILQTKGRDWSIYRIPNSFPGEGYIKIDLPTTLKNIAAVKAFISSYLLVKDPKYLKVPSHVASQILFDSTKEIKFDLNNYINLSGKKKR